MADRIDSRDLVKELDRLVNHTANPSYVENDRITKLHALIEELSENCDEKPENGIQLIPVVYFVDYAQEYADECGYLDYEIKTPNASLDFHNAIVQVKDKWPFKHIDWEAAADELKEDWHEVEFDGTTYLAR